jgi:predicted enzyme related to lactoylglutathione lyase
MKNPVCYSEIPVIDLERTIAFYTAVFGYQLEHVEVDGDEMAMFHASPEASRMTAALAKGESCCRAF